MGVSSQGIRPPRKPVRFRQLDPERLEFQGDLTGDGIIVCPDSTRHQKTLDDRDDSWNQCPAEDRVEYTEADLAHVEAVCA